MMTLKVVAAILALLASIFYWIFSFVTIYHLTRFGIGVQPKRFAAVFFFGSVVLFAGIVLAFALFYTNPPPLPW